MERATWNQKNADSKYLEIFTLWREIHTMDAIKKAYKKEHELLTVVTPYVYKVFGSMYGKLLKQIEPCLEKSCNWHEPVSKPIVKRVQA